MEIYRSAMWCSILKQHTAVILATRSTDQRSGFVKKADCGQEMSQLVKVSISGKQLEV